MDSLEIAQAIKKYPKFLKKFRGIVSSNSKILKTLRLQPNEFIILNLCREV